MVVDSSEKDKKNTTSQKVSKNDLKVKIDSLNTTQNDESKQPNKENIESCSSHSSFKSSSNSVSSESSSIFNTNQKATIQINNDDVI